MIKKIFKSRTAPVDIEQNKNKNDSPKSKVYVNLILSITCSILTGYKLIKEVSFWISVRFLLAMVMFLGYTLVYMQRSNMSIAIVCMVNSTAVLELESQHNINSNLSKDTSNAASMNQDVCVSKVSENHSNGKFVWSKADQGLILAAFFYGYTLTQIPGGWLSMRYGARSVMFVAMLVPSILTIITPLIADLNSPMLLFAQRILIGLLHGVISSSMIDIFSYWAPAKERATLIGFSTSGISLGVVISSVFGGYLCEYGFHEGWGSIFILFGTFGLVWLILLLSLTSDSPRNHKFISQAERDYIMLNIPHTKPVKHTPWKKIFTSKACWAFFITNFCFNWGEYVFLTQTPTFLSDVLKIDIKSNGIYSSLPFVVSFFLTIISGFVSDKLVHKKLISLKNSRKLFNSIGMLVPMVVVVMLGYIDCSKPVLAVVLLTLGIGMIGSTLGAGFMVNVNDIGGKHYSGIIFAVSNTFANIPGIIAPYFAGLMTSHGTIEEWRVAFFVTAVVYLFGTVPFLLFAEVDVEKWAIVEQANESFEENRNTNVENKEAINNQLNPITITS